MTKSTANQNLAPVEGFELSPQQARWWRWQENHPLTDSDSELRLTMSADVDLVRAQSCLQSVIDRHEILRTRYHHMAGLAQPLQVIEERAPLHWVTGPVHENGSLQAVYRPLVQGGYEVRLRLPAANADAPSIFRIVHEWAALYLGHTLDDVSLHYADYSAWRNELKGSNPHADAMWQSERARQSPLLKLPFRSLGSASATPRRWQKLVLTVTPEVQAQWSAAAMSCDVSPTILALAAWVTLLVQHAEAEHLSLGLDWQTRSLELQAAIGLFCEPLPLTVENAGELRFVDLVKSLAHHLGRFEEGRDYFFANPATDQVPAAGFRNLAPLNGSLPKAAGFHVEEIVMAPSAQHLLLEWVQLGALSQLSLYYNDDLYDKNTALIIGEHYLAILSQCTRDFTRKIRSICGLSQTEHQLVTEVLSQSAALSTEGEATYRRLVDLPHLRACFGQAMLAYADRPAVRSTTRCLSYAQLHQRSERLAAHIHQRLANAPAGQRRIVHALPRDVDALVAMLAIFQAGAAYVPVDPEYPAARIAFILDDCQADLLLTCRTLAPRFSGQEPERMLFIDDLDLAVEPSHDKTRVAQAVACDASETAYIIYTSGSTGQPRGVPISHANALYSLAARLAYYPEPIGCFLLLSSLAFDSSIAGLFATLAQGGCLRIASELEQKDPAQVVACIRSEAVTHLLALPSLYQLILEKLVTPPPALQVVIVAGEACPRVLVDMHYRLRPEVRLYNEYGATEASVWSTVGLCYSSSVNRAVSIGCPIPYTRVYILDDDREPRPRGLRGEIYVGGPGLCAGYLNRAELTREKFVEVRGERLYRTGDFAYWDDQGELVFLGRADGQVKIRGYRIELGEIEAVLRRTTGLDRVVVLADRGVDGELFLRAFVETEKAVDFKLIQAELARELPQPMVPSAIQALRYLPRNANGKFDRGALLALQPERSRPAYEAPSTASERALVALWERLLGQAPIGRHDDFFALGGHSLLAVRLVHEIQATQRVVLPITSVFAASKLADMAAEIAKTGGLACVDGSSQSSARLLCLTANDVGVPLLCFDPSGLHLRAYQSLADCLADERPVWGVTHDMTMTLGEQPYTRMVSVLAQAILERHRGPFHLLGWSFGGVLALGVARALEEQGHEVAFLGLLDSQPYTRLYGDSSPDIIEELACYVDVDRRADLFALPPAERLAVRDRLSQLHHEQRVVEAIAWAQNRGLIRDASEPAAFVPRYILHKNAALTLNAWPEKALSAAICVWWSSETWTRHGGPIVDFQKYSRFPLRTFKVAGDHDALVANREVHQQIRALLRKPVAG